MQPIKITIKGNFFDCQIYRGRLYLWTFEGALKIYDWEQIVYSLIENENDKLAMVSAFLEGRYLYDSNLKRIFDDADFKELLYEKFLSINKREIQLTEKQILKYLLGEQDTPTNIIPTDTEIYSSRLYFINENGLFASTAHRKLSDKYLVSSKPTKLWDCNILSIKANKYPQIALSAGNEGLFELNMSELTYQSERLNKIDESRKLRNHKIYQISKKHSSFSNYSFLSIYSTSLFEDSFLALFNWEKKEKKSVDEELASFHLFAKQSNVKREFCKDILDKNIFEDNKPNKVNVSWGVDDKIYKITKRGFEIVKFNNFVKEDEYDQREIFTKLNFYELEDGMKGRVLNSGTAYFGNIIEYENGLIVVQSDGDKFLISEPITRWRIYSRSRNYENHLHVILDDRIEIYSFNHDYFLNQKEKQIGITYTFPKNHFKMDI